MATKTELEEKIKDLQKEVKVLKTEVNLLILDNGKLEDELAMVQDLMILSEESDDLVLESDEGEDIQSDPVTAEPNTHEDCIILDGVHYKAMLVETAQELVQSVRRGETLENQTCLTINREGA